MSPLWSPLIVLGAMTALATWTTARLRRWVAEKRILDVPNERSSHAQPTPRGGGLTIAVGSTIAGACAIVLHPIGSWVAVIVGGALIAAIGWLDDVKSLGVKIRFGAQIAAAIAVIALSSASLTVALPFAAQASGVVALVLGGLWIVGLTNSYNFMDGIDGIAGTQGVVAGLGWLWFGLRVDALDISIFAAALAGTSAGFLVHNWPPAKIFMGDVGSTYLGFALAGLGVLGTMRDPLLGGAGALLVWPFVFDAGSTFVSRLLRRQDVLRPHREHLYQRLLIAGWSHRAVTVLYGGLAVLGVGFAALWLEGAAVAVLAGLGVACVVLWMGVLRVERRAG